MRPEDNNKECRKLHLTFNGLLVCVTLYSMFNYLPEYPYAFAACALALCHGLLGLIQALQHTDDSNPVKVFSNTIMKLIPMTLINIELYLDSSNKSIAAVHYVFLIPLALELVALLFTEDEEYKSVKVLKNMAIIGNILSLFCLTWTEDNFIFAIIALMAISIKYGKNWIERYPISTNLGSTTLYYSVIALYLVGVKNQVIASKKSFLPIKVK